MIDEQSRRVCRLQIDTRSCLSSHVGHVYVDCRVVSGRRRSAACSDCASRDGSQIGGSDVAGTAGIVVDDIGARIQADVGAVQQSQPNGSTGFQ